MVILLAASVFSWTIILQRSRQLKKTQCHTADFEEQFWSGIELSRLGKTIANYQNPTEIESIFLAGIQEFQRKTKAHLSDKLEACQRSMRIAQSRARHGLEEHVGWLATIGSVSPYVGLFGTVWGIMTAFQALGKVNQATIAMVAPGISEALIATAIGLFAAIPAVIAYNRFTNRLALLEEQWENFSEEMINVLQGADTAEPHEDMPE